MTPEQKCVSLETARKLLAAGFPQDTGRWWFSTNGEDWSLGGAFSSRTDGNIAAPDAQEIGELLPEQTDAGFFRQEKGLGDEGEYWSVMYYSFEEPLFETEPVDGYPNVKKLKPSREKITIIFEAENEAEARAACFIWLKEQKLI